MPFDQGELNFSGGGSEEGFHNWRRALDKRKRAFEIRWSVSPDQGLLPIASRRRSRPSHEGRGLPEWKTAMVNGRRESTKELMSAIFTEAREPD